MHICWRSWLEINKWWYLRVLFVNMLQYLLDLSKYTIFISLEKSRLCRKGLFYSSSDDESDFEEGQNSDWLADGNPDSKSQSTYKTEAETHHTEDKWTSKVSCNQTSHSRDSRTDSWTTSKANAPCSGKSFWYTISNVVTWALRSEEVYNTVHPYILWHVRKQNKYQMLFFTVF